MHDAIRTLLVALTPIRSVPDRLTPTLGALVLLTTAAGLAPDRAFAQSYYADVRPVLVQECMGCHTEDGIAWPMDDAEETFEKRRQIAGVVTEREMPPWLAEPGHQEYVDDLSLDDEVLGVVAAWRDAEFPEGTPRADPPRPERGHTPFAADVAIDVLPGQSYLPDQTMDDDYRCFVTDWTGEEPGYVTGFRAVPGNLDVAHHVVVYAVEPSMTERFRELEAEEEGPGYQCFGGAVPDRLASGSDREDYESRYPDGVRELSQSTWWLAHWAPGMYGETFPEGTGIPLEPGAGLVVQMHYYTAEAPDEADADSRLEFQVAGEVERPAFHLAQTYNPWLASERNGTMVVPPGEKATYEVSDDLASLVPYISRITDVDEPRIEGLEIHSANLHMHAFGHSGVISLVDGDGRHETLLSVPRWDIHWQRDFTFTEPKIFARDELDGASIRVRCTYENPTDEVVYGGYGSYDEMCFNFSYIAVQTGDAVKDADAPGP